MRRWNGCFGVVFTGGGGGGGGSILRVNLECPGPLTSSLPS